MYHCFNLFYFTEQQSPYMSSPRTHVSANHRSRHANHVLVKDRRGEVNCTASGLNTIRVIIYGRAKARKKLH
jgi:hypothetical protein